MHTKRHKYLLIIHEIQNYGSVSGINETKQTVVHKKCIFFYAEIRDINSRLVVWNA